MHNLGINAGELRGNRLTQVHLEMMAVKMECVREGNVLWCKVLGNFTATGMTGTPRVCGNPARMDADAAGMERGVKRLSAGM